MLIPYSVSFRNGPSSSGAPAWDDPIRTLYPHHAEFWPRQVPEHVMLKQKARKIAKLRRWRFLKKLLPGFLTRKPGQQVSAHCGPLCNFEKQPGTFGAA